MDFVTLILCIAFTGFFVYVITMIPMAEPFRRAIYAISILALVLYLLQAFGITNLPFIHIEKLKIK